MLLLSLLKKSKHNESAHGLYISCGPQEKVVNTFFKVVNSQDEPGNINLMFNITFSCSLAVLFPLCVKEVIKFKNCAIERWSSMEHFQQAGHGRVGISQLKSRLCGYQGYAAHCSLRLTGMCQTHRKALRSTDFASHLLVSLNTYFLITVICSQAFP